MLVAANTSLRTLWQSLSVLIWLDNSPRNVSLITVVFPRLSISHCFLIYAWRWLICIITDSWLSACLEAVQGLNQWKQLGFIFNFITLWKSLVYKHNCLTSNHSDLMLRSPRSVCCHILPVVLTWCSESLLLPQASLQLRQSCSLLWRHPWKPLQNLCHCLWVCDPHTLNCFQFVSNIMSGAN